jgi:hypothetical protein
MPANVEEVVNKIEKSLKIIWLCNEDSRNQVVPYYSQQLQWYSGLTQDQSTQLLMLSPTQFDLFTAMLFSLVSDGSFCCKQIGKVLNQLHRISTVNNTKKSPCYFEAYLKGYLKVESINELVEDSVHDLALRIRSYLNGTVSMNALEKFGQYHDNLTFDRYSVDLPRLGGYADVQLIRPNDIESCPIFAFLSANLKKCKGITEFTTPDLACDPAIKCVYHGIPIRMVYTQVNVFPEVDEHNFSQAAIETVHTVPKTIGSSSKILHSEMHGIQICDLHFDIEVSDTCHSSFLVCLYAPFAKINHFDTDFTFPESIAFNHFNTDFTFPKSKSLL